MPKSILDVAIAEFIDRCRGDEFPEGVYDDDGSFKPAPSEVCPMCAGLEADPEVTPEMYYTHCLTAKHVAMKYDLDVAMFESSLALALGTPMPEEIDAEAKELIEKVMEGEPL